MIKSPIIYNGKKERLLPQISPLYPNTINNYYEPFCGGASVFFDLYSQNIINGNYYLSDLNWRVLRLYEVIRDDLSGLDTTLQCFLSILNKEGLFYYLRSIEDIGSSNALPFPHFSLGNSKTKLAAKDLFLRWLQMGKVFYPDAQELLISADCGGSNSYRARLCPWELQQLANELGLAIQICHFPPGTSKWNKIEHRLFSQITENWRGRPLISREVVVNLIANTTTHTGLKVNAALDEGQYPTGIKVSDQQFDSIEIERELFHGEWNYKIFPSPSL